MTPENTGTDKEFGKTRRSSDCDTTNHPRNRSALKKLGKELGLTGPQLILMRSIKELGEVTIRELSNNTNMSQATATTILDRLERNGYVKRVRSMSDKRKVHAYLTDEGKAILEKAPLPLQDNFIDQFHQLEEWEQSLLLSSVQRLSSMMNAESYDVAPVLEIGSITKNEQPAP